MTKTKKKYIGGRWDSVKDDEIFDELKARKPTFERGNYSMREQTAGFYAETSAADRKNFIEVIRNIIMAELDKVKNENIR